MKTNISRALRRIADTLAPANDAPLLGEYLIRVVRADGRVEEKVLRNVVTRAGLNRIANRAVQATGTSPFYVIVVGTQTAAHSLDSAQVGIGEVLRKSSNFTGANAQSREWIFMQATFGGFADNVTGVLLDTVGMYDYPNSGATVASGGTLGSAVNGMGVTLQGSDLLDVTYRARVGSHNLSHST